MKKRFAIQVNASVIAFVLVVIAAIIAPACAQNQSLNKPGETMHTFVLIFHQGSPAPTAEERQRTGRDVVAWAEKLNADGHDLDPRILTPEITIRGEHGVASLPSEGSPITALLFIKAKDLEEATRIAESHPALRNRIVVEVREWHRPTRPASQ
jgi:hypothetical protein